MRRFYFKFFFLNLWTIINIWADSELPIFDEESNISLTEMIEDYKDSYEENFVDFNQVLQLQGILYINKELWIIWINNIEIFSKSSQDFLIHNKKIEILEVTHNHVRLMYDNREVDLSLGMNYNIITHTLTCE